MSTKFPNMWNVKIEEKICTKDYKHTRKYLHDSTIYVRKWKDFTILRNDKLSI